MDNSFFQYLLAFLSLKVKFPDLLASEITQRNTIMIWCRISQLISIWKKHEVKTINRIYLFLLCMVSFC